MKKQRFHIKKIKIIKQNYTNYRKYYKKNYYPRQYFNEKLLTKIDVKATISTNIFIVFNYLKSFKYGEE